MQAQLTDSLLAEREQLIKDFGWSPSTEQQTASSKGFQTMSQDTGEELNGRFTALQISNEEIKNTMLSMLTIANTISISVNNNGIILAEIRNLVITSNDYLDNIAVYTKKILEEFGSKLDNINQNIAKAL